MHLRDTIPMLTRSARSGWAAALLLVLAAGPNVNAAQVGATSSAVPVRGKIVSVNGPDLVVASGSGDVKMEVADNTIIRGEVPIKFSDITSGMYLGTTATKQPDGTFLASEVHVFSADQRGTGEGHYPLGSAPQSGATMTNGNVEHVEDSTVQNRNGRLMTVKYKGGEVKVFVPPDIRLVKREAGNRSLLKPGAEISARATRASDGALTATQITVRAPRK